MRLKYLTAHQRHVLDIQTVIVRNLAFPRGRVRACVLELRGRGLVDAFSADQGGTTGIPDLQKTYSLSHSAPHRQSRADILDVRRERGELGGNLVYRSPPAPASLNPSWALHDASSQIAKLSVENDFTLIIRAVGGDTTDDTNVNNDSLMGNSEPEVLEMAVNVRNLVCLGLTAGELSTLFALPVNSLFFVLSDGKLYTTPALKAALQSYGAIAKSEVTLTSSQLEAKLKGEILSPPIGVKGGRRPREGSDSDISVNLVNGEKGEGVGAYPGDQNAVKNRGDDIEDGSSGRNSGGTVQISEREDKRGEGRESEDQLAFDLKEGKDSGRKNDVELSKFIPTVSITVPAGECKVYSLPQAVSSAQRFIQLQRRLEEAKMRIKNIREKVARHVNKFVSPNSGFEASERTSSSSSSSSSEPISCSNAATVFSLCLPTSLSTFSSPTRSLSSSSFASCSSYSASSSSSSAMNGKILKRIATLRRRVRFQRSALLREQRKMVQLAGNFELNERERFPGSTLRLQMAYQRRIDRESVTSGGEEGKEFNIDSPEFILDEWQEHPLVSLSEICARADAALTVRSRRLDAVSAAMASARCALEDKIKVAQVEREDFAVFRRQLFGRQLKLFGETRSIYGIDMWLGKGSKYGDAMRGGIVYTIRGLPLPPRVSTLRISDLTSKEVEDLAIALGFVCHLVQIMARHLSLTLRYGLWHAGSRSFVTDAVPIAGTLEYASDGPEIRSTLLEQTFAMGVDAKTIAANAEAASPPPVEVESSGGGSRGGGVPLSVSMSMSMGITMRAARGRITAAHPRNPNLLSRNGFVGNNSESNTSGRLFMSTQRKDRRRRMKDQNSLRKRGAWIRPTTRVGTAALGSSAQSGGPADVPGLQFPLFGARTSALATLRFSRAAQMLELDIEQVVRARGLSYQRVPPDWPILRKLRAVFEADMTQG